MTGPSLDFQKEGKAALQRPNSRAWRAELLWHRLAFAGMQGVTAGSGQEPGLCVGEITAKMFFSPKIHVQKEKNIFVKQAATSTVQGKLGLVQCFKKKEVIYLIQILERNCSAQRPGLLLLKAILQQHSRRGKLLSPL